MHDKSPAEPDPDELVVVRRHPGDHRGASYRLSDIGGARLDILSGGVGKKSHRPMLYGYVLCNAAVVGEVAHSGAHGPCPHSIKVVIQKSDNDPRIWHYLAGQEYKPPAPLDMSPEAVEARSRRSRKAADTRAKKRRAAVERLIDEIGQRWPTGRIPSAEKLAQRFETSKGVASDARREVIRARRGET